MLKCDDISNKELVTVTASLAVHVLVSMSLIMEGVAFASDRKWNQILDGQDTFYDPKGYFMDKGVNLNESMYPNVINDVYKDSTFESGYIGILVLVIVATLIQQILFFTWKPIREQRSLRIAVKIGYFSLGCLILVAIALQTSSMSSIKNNYLVVHEKLFELSEIKSQNYTAIENDQLDETVFLKDIFGICLRKSISYQLNHNNIRHQGELIKRIELNNGQLYSHSRLVSLGFCQKETHKIIAAVFGLMSVFMCWTVSLVEGCMGYADDADIDIKSYSPKTNDPGIDAFVLKPNSSSVSRMGINKHIQRSSIRSFSSNI